MYYSFISCIFFKSIKYQTKNVRLHFLKEYIIYFACQTNMIWACLDFQKIKQQNFFFFKYIMHVFLVEKDPFCTLDTCI